MQRGAGTGEAMARGPGRQAMAQRSPVAGAGLRALVFAAALPSAHSPLRPCPSGAVLLPPSGNLFGTPHSDPTYIVWSDLPGVLSSVGIIISPFLVVANYVRPGTCTYKIQLRMKSFFSDL